MAEIVAIRKASETGETKPPPTNNIPTGRLEITIKISELPTPRTVQNGWQQFDINCDGIIFTITVKPKVWNKFSTAAASYPMWVAAIAGKMGAKTGKGFIMDSPGIQIFEKKPKESQEEAPAE